MAIRLQSAIFRAQLCYLHYRRAERLALMRVIYPGQDAHSWRLIRRAALVAAAMLASLAVEARAATADPSRTLTLQEIRSIPTAEMGIPRPTSLAFSTRGRTLLVGQKRRGRTVVRRLSLHEKRLGRLSFRTSESTMGFDPFYRSVTVVGRGGIVLMPSGRVVKRLRLREPRGVTVDARRKTSFILDARARSIVRIPARGRVRSFSVAPLGSGPLRGIAFNSADRLLYVLAGNKVFGLDSGMRIRRTLTITALHMADPQAIVFAPSGDPTDDPKAQSLYIIDRGSTRSLGRLVETSVAPRMTTAPLVAEQVTGSLVQLIHTSNFSPASPDPAGIAYLAASDRLLIADSEVEEMTIWAGKNLFSTTRTGSGLGTGSTYPYSKEPAGIGIDPNTNTLYISDDDKDTVFQFRPGADGVHGTADDSRPYFSVAAISTDPEGIEFDAATGRIWICDGLALEVFTINAVDGIFGNGNDSVTSFDVAQHGMRDCEGLGQDPARGTLLAIDPSRRNILELTETGGLVRVIDLNGIPTTNRNFASVTVAPTSDPNDSPSATNYWIVDRQVDNGVDPNENDGKLYEVSTGAPPPADEPPSVALTAPTDGAVLTGAATLGATASDDAGVTQVAFFAGTTQVGADTNGADGWSLSWDTTTVSNGTYILTATATDTAGNRTTSNSVTVTVNHPAPADLSVAVRTGSDDADQIPDGTVRRSNGDLEIGSEQTGLATTLGMRFTGLAIPRGATIQRAYVQFTADEKGRPATSVTIGGHASDNSPGFTTTRYDISARARTAASVGWTPPQWLTFGAAGLAERTPDVSAVVQEIVNRAGWASGNALTIIISGSGRRTAESYEGGKPPILRVEFASP